jgi:hypothetical protein
MTTAKFVFIIHNTHLILRINHIQFLTAGAMCCGHSMDGKRQKSAVFSIIIYQILSVEKRKKRQYGFAYLEVSTRRR